jgi:exodeoxyribonuclease-3
MKIAAWNVNSVKARLEHAVKWLQEFEPDVLMLQELKCQTEAFPLSVFEDLGYNCAVHGQKTYNGVAILSKSPLHDVQVGLPGDDSDDHARYIEAMCSDVRLISVYVPNGADLTSDKFVYKMAFYERLQARLAELKDLNETVVIGGDFNVALRELDCYDPEKSKGRLLCSDPERMALRSLIHTGYTDTFTALHPSEQLFSWWDYRAGRWQSNHGFRIDYIFTSPAATDRLKAAGIDPTPRGWDRPSDHTPVWIDLGEKETCI